MGPFISVNAMCVLNFVIFINFQHYSSPIKDTMHYALYFAEACLYVNLKYCIIIVVHICDVTESWATL
jgi:hypothetical protein